MQELNILIESKTYNLNQFKMSERLSTEINWNNWDKSQNEIKIDTWIKELWEKLWISSESAKKLSELKTITDISILKNELSKLNVDNSKFDETNEQDEIFSKINEIREARENLQNEAKKQVASLKEWLEKVTEYKINQNNSISSKLFSSELLAKVENPEHIWHNLIWWFIWTLDTWYSLANYTKDLVIWIAKTPVDLYKIATKKAEIDSFKNI